jgi:hypothetical protein
MLLLSKKTSDSYARKLLMLPLIFLVTGLFAFTYKTKTASAYLPVNSLSIHNFKLFTSKNIADTIPHSHNEPLYVLDGKVQTGKTIRELVNLDPNQIETINVLKNEAAIAKYGEKAKEGVIEITTKSKFVEAKVSARDTTPVVKGPQITVDELRAAAPHQLMDLPAKTEIVSYTFTIDLPNDAIVHIPNAGNSFNERTKAEINVAQAGRIVTLDNIRAKIDGQIKRLPSRIWFIVK